MKLGDLTGKIWTRFGAMMRWLSHRWIAGVFVLLWYLLGGLPLAESQLGNVAAAVIGGLLTGGLVLWVLLWLIFVVAPAINGFLLTTTVRIIDPLVAVINGLTESLRSAAETIEKRQEQ